MITHARNHARFPLPTYPHIRIPGYVRPKIPFGKSCLHPAKSSRLLGKKCHGMKNAMRLFAGLYLVSRTWYGSCFVYWQAGQPAIQTTNQ